jgi:16S rRNA (guanine1207-N2)-methyltransferase
MTDHYYTHSPQAKRDPRVIQVAVRDIELELQTDNGVFSKAGLDEATRRLLEQVWLPSDAFVLDLGCGYGPVTAVLGKVYPDSRWVLVDVNERALELAALNTAMFGERCQTICSDGIPPDLVEVFTDVILNPPIRAGKAVVYRLFEDAHRALQMGGRLWVVIQKKHGAPSAYAELENRFSEVETVYRKSGYFVFLAKKLT